MIIESALKLYSREEIANRTMTRLDEVKVGERIKVLDTASTHVSDLAFSELLTTAYKNEVRYALLLIPEDIGPRANLGRAGSQLAPLAFMSYFCNMQANQFFDYAKLAIIGEVIVDDLQNDFDPATRDPVLGWRQLCAKLDERVEAIVTKIIASGMELICIGGGNNNSFPIIAGVVKGLSQKTGTAAQAIACINCDAHADFRDLEGRHSGNPFSYAYEGGYLKRYCVLGLQEDYNSQTMLERLDQLRFPYFSYDSFAVRQEISFEDCLLQAVNYLKEKDLVVGCELDLDCIMQMPTSARSPIGITQAQAAQYIHKIASTLPVKYAHFSEGAPKLTSDDGQREIGKSLAAYVSTFLKAREAHDRLNAKSVNELGYASSTRKITDSKLA